MAKNTNRYHIGKNGLPAVCQAKKQLCPLGGEDSHYSTKEEAQIEADKLNSKKFPMFKKKKKWNGKKVNQKETPPVSKEKKDKVEKMKSSHPVSKKQETKTSNQNGPKSYGDRIVSIEVYEGEIKQGVESYHYQEERADRSKYYDDTVGVGTPIAKFAINDGRAKTQLHEIYDNGKIRIYDIDTHKPVTLLLARPERMKGIFKRAGIPMPDGLLETTTKNSRLIDRKKTS